MKIYWEISWAEGRDHPCTSLVRASTAASALEVFCLIRKNEDRSSLISSVTMVRRITYYEIL